MTHIIEIREYAGYHPDMIENLEKLLFDSKEELIEVLIKLGLPDTLWTVRVHTLDDFLSMINNGDSFHAVTRIDLNFLLESERLLDN